MDQQTPSFYDRLKQELENTTPQWPSEYLYKFILPDQAEKIQAVEKVFENMNATVKTQASKNGKYRSVSVRLMMPSADAIIAKYQEVSTIEGIISL